MRVQLSLPLSIQAWLKLHSLISQRKNHKTLSLIRTKSRARTTSFTQPGSSKLQSEDSISMTLTQYLTSNCPTMKWYKCPFSTETLFTSLAWRREHFIWLSRSMDSCSMHSIRPTTLIAGHCLTDSCCLEHMFKVLIIDSSKLIEMFMIRTGSHTLLYTRMKSSLLVK
jgi:hypothetical protein